MIFVPIWDMNHLKSIRFPYVTVALILINTVVFAMMSTHYVLDNSQDFIDSAAVIPQHFLHRPIAQNLRGEDFNFISYMFIHGDFFHLLGNMIFLFVYGDNVEDAMGHFWFVIFYLACGVLAAVAHILLTDNPAGPLIGASGAIAGIIGAYFMLHPHIRVWVLLPLPFLPFVPARFSAGFVIGVWLVYQGVSQMLYPDATTAWWTHLGGFAAGVLLILVMRRPGVPLFDRATGV